jgi:hypothetical protein
MDDSRFAAAGVGFGGEFFFIILLIIFLLLIFPSFGVF